jgi:hypothetical protein
MRNDEYFGSTHNSLIIKKSSPEIKISFSFIHPYFFILHYFHLTTIWTIYREYCFYLFVREMWWRQTIFIYLFAFKYICVSITYIYIYIRFLGEKPLIEVSINFLCFLFFHSLFCYIFHFYSLSVLLHVCFQKISWRRKIKALLF